VEDVRDALQRSPHVVRVRYVTLDKLDVGSQVREILAAPRAQIVQDAHAIAAAHQRFGNMRPNEPGTTRDQVHAHSPERFPPRSPLRRRTAWQR
jgi:hypothetical protein